MMLVRSYNIESLHKNDIKLESKHRKLPRKMKWNSKKPHFRFDRCAGNIESDCIPQSKKTERVDNLGSRKESSCGLFWSIVQVRLSETRKKEEQEFRFRSNGSTRLHLSLALCATA